MSMKMTGIVRRMDDLGRVVIPKEVTRATCAHEQQAYKISVQGTDILLKKEDTTDRHNMVRTVDDLRRLAIPRTIRRELGLNEGQPLEILHDFDNILLRPFEVLPEPVAVEEVQEVEEIQESPKPLKLRWTYVAIPAGKTFDDFVDYENFEEFKTMSEARAYILEHEKDGLFNIDLFDLTEEEEGNMECISTVRAEKRDGIMIIR